MAEFGTFSLKDAIAPALQVRQMRMQEAETQGVLAKLSREREMRDRRQQTLSAIGPDSDLDALDTAQRDLLKAGDTEGAAEVGKLSDAAFNRQFERQKQQDDVALKWMGVIQKSPEILNNPEFRKYLAGPGGIGQAWAAELTPDNLKDADDALKRRKLLAETLAAERNANLPSAARTELGKLKQDYAEGRIGEDEFVALKNKILQGRAPEGYVTVYKDGSVVGSYPKGDPRLPQFQGQPGVTIATAAAQGTDARTELGKLKQDLDEGRIGEDEFFAARNKILQGRAPENYVTVYQNGEVVGSYPKDDPRLKQFQGQRGVVIGTAAATGTAADIGAPDKTEMRAIRTQIRNSEGNIEELDKALSGVLATPEATGVRGVVIEKLGGLLGQLPVVGPEATNMLGTPEVQAVRTRLQSILGRFIGAITGDTSGRYSNKDLQLAQTAAQATNPTASYEQVVSALKTLREIEAGALERNRSALGGAAPQTSGIPIPDALKDTPDGSEIRNNSTGKVYVRRGNRLIEK
jgi:hypothetical protein